MNVCGDHCTSLAGDQEVGAYGYCGLHDAWWVMTEKWAGAADPQFTSLTSSLWTRVKTKDVPQEIRDRA